MTRCALLLAIAVWFAAAMAAAERVRVASDSGAPELIEQVRAELGEIDPPDSIFEARRQARRAAERAEAYLNSRGYFDADIRHAVEAGPPIRAMVKVEPGPRFEIGDIELDFGAARLPGDVRAGLEDALIVQTGAPAIPSDVVSQEAGLIAALKSLGYAEAEARARRVMGDRETGTIDVRYRLRPGPRIRLGEVRFDDGVRTRRPYLERLIPFEPGEVYTPKALSDFNRRLGATRLYAVSSAQLASEPTRRTETGEEVRDVLVTLKERERYTLTAGASVSTSEGPGLTTSLTRRNASRRGDTLTGSATLAAQQRAFRVEWRIPNAVAYDRGLVFNAETVRDETDAFDREAITLSGAYEVRQSPRFTYAVGAGGEFTREEDALGQRDLQILSVSAGARLDRSDDPLDPATGWRADARVEPAMAIGDRTSQFVRLNAQLSGYRPLVSDKLVLAARVRNGFVYGATIDDLPVSRRFFAGGGGSARGFAFQSVGPEDEDGAPIGGRGLLEMSGELRWRGDADLGYAAFLDAATVSEDQAPRFEDLRYSAGAGVRYRTAVGPVRFDIATPLDREDGDDVIQIYISLGQAF